MEQQAREAYNAYMRNYYKNNKQKIKQTQQRYWENKLKKMKGDDEDVHRKLCGK